MQVQDWFEIRRQSKFGCSNKIECFSFKNLWKTKIFAQRLEKEWQIEEVQNDEF